jgi:hypothetical protein
MPLGQVTVTAKTGPDRTNTALVVSNVQAVNFDLMQPSLQIQTVTATGDNIKEYDLTGVTTVTCSVTSGVLAFVVS